MRTWAFLAAMAASGAAMAADPPADGGARWDPARMEQMRAAREARRADDVALLLGLRPDQRPAFDQYMQSMRPRGEEPEGMRPGAMEHRDMANETLPARLDAMQAFADRRDAMAKQRIAATRQFYASLSPDQQRRFDALDRLRHDHMGPRHGGMHGHWMGSRGAPPPPPAG